MSNRQSSVHHSFRGMHLSINSRNQKHASFLCQSRLTSSALLVYFLFFIFIFSIHFLLQKDKRRWNSNVSTKESASIGSCSIIMINSSSNSKRTGKNFALSLSLSEIEEQMGDSSGLLEINSNGENKANSVSAALGGSVSFGRFLSESLDWGKWSSFCQKRHLEEIEKCSTPGSVAQKKAYFEAHYKKAAAGRRKPAASLLEQANVAVASNCSESCCNLKPVSEEFSSTEATQYGAVEEGSPKTSSGEEKYDSITGDKSMAEPSLLTESSEMVDDIENQNRVNDLEEEHRDNSLEKQPLKESSTVNQETRDSVEKKKKKRVSAPKPTDMHRPPRLPTSPKLCSPAKSASPSFKSTPASKKYGTESSEKKKSPLGASRMPINFSRGRKGATTPMMSRTSPVPKNVEESKVFSNSSKANRGVTDHVITPTGVSSGRGPKTTPKTPKPELGRLSGRAKVDVKLHRDSAEYNSNRKRRDENFMTGSQLLAQTASPFLSLRSVERVEKRKEIPHNVEDKFRGREAKKLQFRETPKEKAESEIKKLRQNLSFKARPLPAFYHSPEPSKIEKRKVQLTRPQSPKLVRTNGYRANSSAISLPPTQYPVKGDRTTHGRGKSSH